METTLLSCLFRWFLLCRVPPSKAAEGARWMAEKGEELAKVGTVGSGSPGDKTDLQLIQAESQLASLSKRVRS